MEQNQTIQEKPKGWTVRNLLTGLAFAIAGSFIILLVRKFGGFLDKRVDFPITLFSFLSVILGIHFFWIVIPIYEKWWKDKSLVSFIFALFIISCSALALLLILYFLYLYFIFPLEFQFMDGPSSTHSY